MAISNPTASFVYLQFDMLISVIIVHIKEQSSLVDAIKTKKNPCRGSSWSQHDTQVAPEIVKF